MQCPFPSQQFPNPIFHFDPVIYQINYQFLIIANITPNFERPKAPSPSLSSEKEKSFEVLSEKIEEDSIKIMDQLSPNSKVSSLLSKSKRISKPPAPTNQGENSQCSSFENSGKLIKKRRNPWTHSEDQKLLHLFNIYGAQWAKIAASMGERNGKQVRDRYMSVLIENINKGPWTEEEDRIILELYEKIGAQWSRISDHLQRRTETQVKNRFHSHLKRRHERKFDLEIKMNNKVEEVSESNGMEFHEILRRHLSPNQ